MRALLLSLSVILSACPGGLGGGKSAKTGEGIKVTFDPTSVGTYATSMKAINVQLEPATAKLFQKCMTQIMLDEASGFQHTGQSFDETQLAIRKSTLARVEGKTVAEVIRAVKPQLEAMKALRTKMDDDVLRQALPGQIEQARSAIERMEPGPRRDFAQQQLDRLLKQQAELK